MQIILHLRMQECLRLLQDDESDASVISAALYICIIAMEACAHPQPRDLIVLHRILPKEVILQS